MTTAATISAQLILDAKNFISGMKGAEHAADSLSSKMKSVGETMQRVGVGMSLALTVPIVAFLKSSVDSAGQSEAAIADLEAVIRSTGAVAGVTSKAAQDLANSMQLITKFSDEEIVAGEAMLLTFTKIGKDIFPQATQATADMAQKFGMDMSQAAITLGKALNDPIAGVTALRRIGVQLTDQQEASIKAFMAVGDVASAQAVILEELQTQVGGAAEAFGKTFPGQVAIFNNQLDQLKETLGAVLIPTLISFMQAITPIIQALASAPPWVQKLVVGLLLFVAAIGPIIGAVGTLITALAAFAPGGALAGIGTFITASLLPALSGIATVIMGTVIPAIVAFVAANAIWLVPLLLIIATVYLVYQAFATNFGGIRTAAEQLFFIIQYYFVQVWQGVVASFMAILGVVGAWWDEMIMGMRIRLKIEFLLIRTEFMRLQQAWQTGLNFLKSLADRIFNPIIEIIVRVIAAVNELKAAWASMEPPAFLTPGSPTPFEMGLRGVNKEMMSISRRSLPSMQMGLSSLPAPAIGGGTVHYQDNRRFNSGVSATDRKNIQRDTIGTLEMILR